MLLGEIYLEASRGARRASPGFLARNAARLLARGPFARRHARPRPEQARRRLDEAERLAPVAAGARLERKLAEARALLGASLE